jgi:hypothetical protein
MDTMTQELTMTEEMFKEMWQPRRPLAGDEKGVAYPMSREKALSHLFIQTHSQRSKNVMVADVDLSFDSSWVIMGLVEDGKIPMPNWITTNPFTGNAQAGWFLTGTVGSEKGKAWFDAVYEDFKLKAQSDPGYQNAKMRNPIHPNQMTEWLYGGTYTLKELASFTDPMPKHWYTKRADAMLPEVGRNNILFNKLSAWAYREWRKEAFEVRILVEAERLNQEFPEQLPLSEIVAIVSSVERFIKKHFTEEAFSKIQRRRIAKRWGNTKQDNIDKMLAYLDAGFKLKEIAAAEDKSYNAVKLAMQTAKKWRAEQSA